MTQGGYYADPGVCDGPLWRCRGCGQEFRETHWHRTDLGENVECAGCEYERTEGLL